MSSGMCATCFASNYTVQLANDFVSYLSTLPMVSYCIKFYKKHVMKVQDQENRFPIGSNITLVHKRMKNGAKKSLVHLQFSGNM